MSYTTRQIISYEVINEHGVVISGPFRVESEAQRFADYTFANFTLATKLNGLAKDNGVVFSSPSSVTPTSMDYKEVVDGLYITKCDQDWCGNYIQNDMSGNRWRATSEQLFGKRGPDKFSSFTGYHGDLASFSLEIVLSDDTDDDDTTKLHVILELNKIVDGVSDCKGNLISTIRNFLSQRVH